MSKRNPSRTPFTDAFRQAIEETTNENALTAYAKRQIAINDAFDDAKPQSQVHINISTATRED